MIVIRINDRRTTLQAPLIKFKKQDDRYNASIEPKNNRNNTERATTFFSHCSAIISDIRQVVTSIPQITAKPGRKLSKKFMRCY